MNNRGASREGGLSHQTTKSVRRGESLRGLPLRLRLVICSQSPSASDTSFHSPLSSDMLSSSDDSASMSMGSGGDNTVLSAVSILTSSLVLAVCGVDAAALASAGAAEATDEDSTALGSAGAAVAVDAAVMASISVDTNADTSHTLGSVGTTEAEDDDVAAVSAAEAAPPLALTGPTLRGASLTGGGGGGGGWGSRRRRL